jgi:dolichol-phosphate mannosyltransferase
VGTKRPKPVAGEQPTDLSIVLPTYNEAKNLRALVESIDEVLRETAYAYEVVVVDDDSPDRTWAVADELGAEYPVRCVRRTDESGLATAVVRGFREAETDRLVVMDADLQHPPERIPDLIDALADHDIVIGSRFAAGGSVSEFGPIRQLTTLVANWLAWTVLPETRPIGDPQSGFFALDRSVIDGVELRPVGYKILIEILVRGTYEEVEEIGYVFNERGGGESNMTIGTVVNYLRHLARLTLDRR